MKTITIGSRWWSGKDERFVVTSVVKENGTTWVHYKSNTDTAYSCYLESFLSRFSEMPA